MKDTHFQIKYYGQRQNKVIFFLGGWGQSQRLLLPISKILELFGFYCITYTFDEKFFDTNLKQTVNRVLRAKRSILEHIKILSQEGNHDFAIFGTSLGALISLLVTNESPHVKKVIFNIPGIDLAESLWNWDRGLLNFKQELQKKYPTLKSLKKALAPINSSVHFDNLHNKELLIYISAKDTIAISDPNYLKQLLQSHHYKFQLKVNKFFDHGLTGFINLVNFPGYLSFLLK
jgi:dipeptidyl aminopeptidase/acylaminoacyl peptidase